MSKIELKKLTNELLLLSKFNKIKKLRKLSKKYLAVDIAEALNEIQKANIAKIIRMLDSKTSTEVFKNLNSKLQRYIINVFSLIEIRDILLNNFFADEIVDIFHDFPIVTQSKVLKAIPKNTRIEVAKLLKYKDDTAGSIMSVNFIKLKPEWNSNYAIEKIKKSRNIIEETNFYYVVDQNDKLLGSINLHDLIFSDEKTKLKDLIKLNTPYVNINNDQEIVTKVFQKYDLTEVPVIDNDQKLVGIIIIDEIVDILEEEATEDIEKLAGILPTENTYFEIPILKMVKLRTFWLLFLMVSATLSQLVITLFMSIYKINNNTSISNANKITLIVTTMLVPVIPLISGTSGNAGSQSSIMVVRGLSLGVIKTNDWYKILWKELRVGAIIGLILVPINFIRMYIVDIFTLKGDFKLNKDHWYVIIILSCSLFITVCVAKTVGGILPVIAKVCKIDPAVIAAPLLTTIVDAFSTFIFFSISLIFFFSLIS